jgi:hypothetical protein
MASCVHGLTRGLWSCDDIFFPKHLILLSRTGMNSGKLYPKPKQNVVAGDHTLASNVLAETQRRYTDGIEKFKLYIMLSRTSFYSACMKQ